MNVAIIGAGAIGKAIAHVLERANVSVLSWDIDEAKRSAPLKDVLEYARVVFLCVPSRALPDVFKAAGQFVGWESLVVTVSKGLAAAEPPDALFGAFVPPKRFVALMGPMLARELMDGKGGAAVAASLDAESANIVQNLFARTDVRIETSRDVRGVMLCGVLKNVYSIGLGCGAELGLGRNALGRLVSLSVREMAYVMRCMDGDGRSAYGLAGLGDLVATGFSDDSRNRAFGRALARGEQPDFMSEGAASLPYLLALLGSCIHELPFLRLIRDIVIGKGQMASVVRDF